MGESNPLVSVIVVNYNGAEFLAQCLTSVYTQSYRPMEVIVIDNASSDASVRIVKEKFPEVRLLMSETNLGFAGGNNRGVSEATGEYVVLLNNDTTVEAHWLTALLDRATLPGMGAVTSRVVTERIPDKFYEMNGTINYVGHNVMREFVDLTQVFFGSGASLMFRRADVDPPFPEEFFLYHEDVYLSWNLRLAGRDVQMAQRSVVRHRGSASTNREPSTTMTFYQERNRMLNVLFFYEWRTLVLLLPYFILDVAAGVLSSFIVKRKSLTGFLRSFWWIGVNLPWVLRHRATLQSKRKVPDSEIMKWMSYRVVDGEGGVSRWVNRCSRFYATSVGLSYHG